MSEINVTVWDESAAGDRAVFVHGSTTWGDSAFARQCPPAADFRLELVDRRGYGRSRDVDHGDALADADDLPDVVAGGPVHLVGHPFGTVVALLAADAAVGAVRSLTLIEPSCHGAWPTTRSSALRSNATGPAIAALGEQPLPPAEEYLRPATGSSACRPSNPPRSGCGRPTPPCGSACRSTRSPRRRGPSS